MYRVNAYTVEIPEREARDLSPVEILCLACSEGEVTILESGKLLDAEEELATCESRIYEYKPFSGPRLVEGDFFVIEEVVEDAQGEQSEIIEAANLIDLRHHEEDEEDEEEE